MNKKTLVAILLVGIVIVTGLTIYFITNNTSKTETPEQIIKNLLTPEEKASNPEIKIIKSTDDYIRADLFFNPGGYYILAAKVDGKWQKVLEGNGIPTCKEVIPYNFPRDIIPSCLDEEGNLQEI